MKIYIDCRAKEKKAYIKRQGFRKWLELQNFLKDNFLIKLMELIVGMQAL